jgi:hypothetical protein
MYNHGRAVGKGETMKSNHILSVTVVTVVLVMYAVGGYNDRNDHQTEKMPTTATYPLRSTDNCTITCVKMG